MDVDIEPSPVLWANALTRGPVEGATDSVEVRVGVTLTESRSDHDSIPVLESVAIDVSEEECDRILHRDTSAKIRDSGVTEVLDGKLVGTRAVHVFSIDHI